MAAAARIARMPGIVTATANQLRVAKRLVPRRGATLAERFGRLDDRLVFVIGSPAFRHDVSRRRDRLSSGLRRPRRARAGEGGHAGARGVPPPEAARRLRRILAVARRVGLVGSVRAVEQTPELAHLSAHLPLAFPNAVIVHIVRDGRDVACSLLEKPW